MSQKRYPLLRPSSAIIDNLTLGAYVEAAMLDVLHDETLSPEEKVAGLDALARFARSMGDHWRNVSRYYGQSAERIWHRMAGLDPEGLPTAEMVTRIPEVGGRR